MTAFSKKICSIVITTVVLTGLICKASAEETYDPIEPVNRGIFWFNDNVDTYVLGPVARGYNDVIPQSIRTGVKNFFRNIKTPMYLVGDLLQGDFEEFGIHTARFLINTTAGVGGFLDVAVDAGLEHKDSDVGIAFGSWGFGHGPYLVLPILGPSNLRDFLGDAVEWPANPLNAAVVYPPIPNDPWMTVGSVGSAVNGLSTRASLENAIKSGKESSVDYYAFTREAYTQYRTGLIKGGPQLNDDEEE